MSNGIIARGADGFYHPATEEQLRALVQHAYENDGTQLRVLGSTHSVDAAVYTDGFTGPTTPASRMDVLLDLYVSVTITVDAADPRYAVAECEAGAHLGQCPYPPAGPTPWEGSINWELQKRGYALDDLGGISHQTVSGFLLTGSSGGSLKFTVDDNVLRFRFIDGTGTIRDVRADAEDADEKAMFDAFGVSMGLLGVVSKVWLRAGPGYNIAGAQTTTSTELAACPIDLFGEGTDDKPSLARHLHDKSYSRLMWWPQRGFERVQIWDAERIDETLGFERKPYLELGEDPTLSGLAGSLFYVLMGNLDDISAVPGKLGDWFEHLKRALEGEEEDIDKKIEQEIEKVLEHLGKFFRPGWATALAEKELEKELEALSKDLGALEGTEDSPDPLADAMYRFIKKLLTKGLESKEAEWLAAVMKVALPYMTGDVLGLFVSDGVETFHDNWWQGLTMDNQMDDQLFPIDFTELWIPVDQAAAVMTDLQNYYRAEGHGPIGLAQEQFKRTGTISCEVYGATASRFWLSPSYDMPVVRIDVFWFHLNSADANDFYEPFWKLLRKYSFRPHWGKFLPTPVEDWKGYYDQVYPKWSEWLTMRDRLDPKKVFLTEYWSQHMDIAMP